MQNIAHLQCIRRSVRGIEISLFYFSQECVVLIYLTVGKPLRWNVSFSYGQIIYLYILYILISSLDKTYCEFYESLCILNSPLARSRIFNIE